MASLHRDPRSPYYYVASRLPNGKRTLRSTGETDFKRAKIVADALQRMAPGTAESRQQQIKDLIRQMQTLKPQLTFKQCWDMLQRERLELFDKS